MFTNVALSNEEGNLNPPQLPYLPVNSCQTSYTAPKGRSARGTSEKESRKQRKGIKLSPRGVYNI